jgi:hypothetical protein
MQDQLPFDSKKTGLPRLVISIYIAFADSWTMYLMLDFVCELDPLLTYSWIWTFLHSLKQNGFCLKTFAYFDWFCFDSSDYFLGFFPG